MSPDPIDVVPLSPARLDDFMAFFEGEAFSDNPKWSSCYCQCFYCRITRRSVGPIGPPARIAPARSAG